MSRLKVGLDYFPFDVNFFEDIKVLALKGKYGYEGIVVYQRLLCRIYGDKYYYILWDDIYVEALAGFLNISLELLQAIVDKCLKLQLFDANMYSQYKILTSHGIQSRYLKAITATKKVSIKNMLPLEFIPMEHFLLFGHKTMSANLFLRKITKSTWVEYIQSQKTGQSVKAINVNYCSNSANNNTNSVNIEEKVVNCDIKKNTKDVVGFEQGNDANTAFLKKTIEYLGAKKNLTEKEIAIATELILERKNEGYSFDDFKKVIKTKYTEWIADSNDIEKTKAWFRPQTLFSKKHFLKYLEQAKDTVLEEVASSHHTGQRPATATFKESDVKNHANEWANF